MQCRTDQAKSGQGLGKDDSWIKDEWQDRRAEGKHAEEAKFAGIEEGPSGRRI